VNSAKRWVLFFTFWVALLFLALLLVVLPAQAQVTNLLTHPRIQFLDTSGNPLANGHVHTFISGTSTPQSTFTDSGGGTPNANPVVLDSGGFANIWLTPHLSYRITLHNTGHVQQWSIDGVNANTIHGTLVVGTSSVTFSATPTFDASLGTIFTITLTGNVTSSTISNPTSGQVVHFYIAQDVTGGRTFVFPANVQLRGGIYTIASAASAVSILKIYYDGTNWRELGRLSDEQFHNDLAARILNATYYNVREYGATGDGVANDTTAIQAAIDAADAAIVGGTRTPIVFFPPGEYSVNATLNLRNVHIVCAFPNNSSRIIWDGAVGATVMTRSSQTSFFLLEGCNFRSGVNEPAIFLTFSGSSIDALLLLSRLQFNGSTGDAIQLTVGWVNFRAYDIRWDDIGGYAIDATVVAGQNLSSFVLDRFTYDHNRASDPAPGFIRFDNSTANVSNAGTAVISGGRIEVNDAWATDQAIITLAVNNSPTGSRFLGLAIRDATYQDVVGMASDVVIFRDTTNTTASETFILDNFRTSGLSATIGGTWPTWVFIPLPSGGLYGKINFNSGNVEYGALTTVAHPVFRTFATSEFAISVRDGTETVDRWAVRGDGRMAVGDGTNPTDILFFRQAAGVMQLDNDLLVRRLRQTGTALVAGDFATSAGWGSTASVAVTSNSRDNMGRVTVTPNGASIAANPTLTLTFTDGAWPNGSFCIASNDFGTGVRAFVEVTTTTTTMVVTYVGTPVAGNTQTISWICQGRN